ncbi:MAG: histidine kinase [Bacteroidota bacterium]
MQKLLYIIVHLLFWLAFGALSWMTIQLNPGEQSFMSEHLEALFLLGLWGLFNFYAFYFYFQPLLLDQRRYVRYLLVSLAFSAVVSLLFVGLFWLLYPSFRVMAAQKYMESVVGSFLISQCGSLLRGFISWNQNLQNKTALENQSLRNELAMLKAQLSPHFLFNTLNNIDTLIYRSPDEASAMLIKLATLLRYMLYESDGKSVPLEKEIEYINQLTELQRMRFAPPDYVEVTVEGTPNGKAIAPLLFLPFVENAFKFVSKPAAMPAISIHLKITDSGVHLHCQNYFKPHAQEESRKGIGLANARRRLELLYTDAFTLQVTQDDPVFTVDLSLELS